MTTLARPNATQSSSGIRVAASALPSTREAVLEAKAALEGGDYQQIIAFFSIDHAAEVLATALTDAFPEIRIAGCSTAGEIGPAGMMQGGLLLVAFPRDGFRVHTELIKNIGQFGVERATDAVRRIKSRLCPASERLS
ncbi:MAG TPA: FIST N-terminal domain-containing protein, partial [Hyphomicrobium sp.]|nr:FIST N-terminal domain-containing protein [Hyphomicrobium sp.]